MKKRIHFVGIGGIGVSALARYYKAKDRQVTGSDLTASEITEALEKEGIEVSIGLPGDTKLLGTERVVYSQAVLSQHPERRKAQELGIPQFSYPEALGELTRKHATISVSGTHGKSTTTSMVGLLLIKAGLDPTVIVGTKLKEFQDTNCRIGNSEYLVIEGDEYGDAFLHYSPKIIVLTSIEPDHLDYFGTFENEVESYRKYLGNLTGDGILIANQDDEQVCKLAREIPARVVSYTLRQPEAATLRSILQVPGDHNVSNALAALQVARELGVPDETSFAALKEYRGSWRRFEVFKLTISNKQLTLVSDYGHHPTEVRVTVEAARQKWLEKKLWLVFQPHQYNRTYKLFDEFVRVLANLPVDKLILTHIYGVPGREDPASKRAVSAEMLQKAVKEKNENLDCLLIQDFKDIETYLKKHIVGGEIVIVMGAGDIYQLTRALAKEKIK